MRARDQHDGRADRGRDERSPVAGLAAVALLATLLLVPAQRTHGTTVEPLQMALSAYRVPDGIPFPDDDPYRPDVARLGARLFFDPALSHSGTVSCASCHNPEHAWADGGEHLVGVRPGELAVRVPTVLDVAFIDAFGWDGKVGSLEAFTKVPLHSAMIMDMPHDAVLKRLAGLEDYGEQFGRVFPGQGITWDTLEQALATYQRTIVSGTAPFDRWVAGDPSAVSEAARRGFALFNGRAQCSQCHSGWAFTDGSFHDIGVGDGIGRGALFPSSVKLQHAYKVPTLRDVARRGPYMHDSSLPDLAAVIALYDHGGIDRPSRSELIHPLGLSGGEEADLIAFLRTLTSDSNTGGPPLPH